MKIYTKKGDLGQTSLYGGTKTSKSDAKVEAYGSVDELLAYLGLIRDLIPQEKSTIVKIQNFLFAIGAHLANDGKKEKIKLPKLSETEVEFLEKSIDQMDEIVPAMTAFVLPGGNKNVSHIHIARTICRRAERRVVELKEELDPIIIQYLNRLSDYLFMLSRKITWEQGAEEILWEPKV